jgi:hypothetical protein
MLRMDDTGAAAYADAENNDVKILKCIVKTSGAELKVHRKY